MLFSVTQKKMSVFAQNLLLQSLKNRGNWIWFRKWLTKNARNQGTCSFRPSTGSIAEEAVSRNILDKIRTNSLSTINMGQN
jgi:hypothetical protein